MESKLDEKTLLDRLKKNDARAFERIYSAYWEPLFNKAYSYLHNEDDTKELIQELFVELWQNRHIFEIHTSLGAYLHSATRFKAFNYIKSTLVRDRYIASIQSPSSPAVRDVEEAVNYSELHAALHHALKLLPAQPRRVYELRQNQGLSNAEIAETLQISVSTVEKHMIKAVKHIRKQLKPFKNR